MISFEDFLGNSQLAQSIPKFTDELIVSSDSRSFSKENCFLSLYGENFDSIKFIQDVIDKGARFILVEERERNKDVLDALEAKNSKVTFIRVKDIFQFILELGNARSRRFQERGGKVIGLTGSNGKTTNKEMIKHLLSFLGEPFVHATKGNLNNQIGVPLTLFELEGIHKVAVIEMGTNFPGEIQVLADCAAPAFGLITNIGHAHIEFLKSLDGVYEEKTALFRFIKEKAKGDKAFVKNGFDEKLKNIPNLPFIYELSEKNYSKTQKGFELELDGNKLTVENSKLLGDHQLKNMAQCLILVNAVFPWQLDRLEELANSFSPPSMNRGEILEKYSRRFYMDAYNANPSSMKASLQSYLSFLEQNDLVPKDSLFILGDMNELGENSEKFHQEIGALLQSFIPGEAIFIGRFASSYKEGFGEKCHTFGSAEEFKSKFASLALGPKEIFVKGSRSLQLESILDINW
ncbi:MAG: UDP-N-acetylmuramoyl-tripeptide--D-alanyl-D-alanine ligase [Halobacteriovoraceae bacterium]|nr:UDP-N-acetylmuramoyl-tripeptide--D-alanyl-D-alanine ligase [Halobacteriovoraceae bacterium]